MKLLMVSPRYYPHIGGVEYVVKSVAERLAKMGHYVAVLAGEPSVERPYEEVINGVIVVRWPVLSPSGAYYVPMMRNKLREWLKDELKNTTFLNAENSLL